MTWRDRALCVQVGPDLFYPEADVQAQASTYAPAIDTCRQCGVWRECRLVGMTETEGVWGGLSPKQRRMIRRDTGLVADWGDPTFLVRKSREADRALTRADGDVDEVLATVVPELSGHPSMYEFAATAKAGAKR